MADYITQVVLYKQNGVGKLGLHRLLYRVLRLVGLVAGTGGIVVLSEGLMAMGIRRGIEVCCKVDMWLAIRRVLVCMC